MINRHDEAKKLYLAYMRKLGRRDIAKYQEASQLPTPMLEALVQRLADEYHYLIGQYKDKKRVNIKLSLDNLERISHETYKS